jgi:hypothetical protein
MKRSSALPSQIPGFRHDNPNYLALFLKNLHFNRLTQNYRAYLRNSFPQQRIFTGRFLMATDKQLNANRINARKSCGPKTEEGKGIVRLNALKHGLCAEVIDVIPGEKEAEFAAHVDAWVNDFTPRNAYERHLIRNAARLSWKLDRASRHEVAASSRRVTDAIDACEDDSTEAIVEAAALASFDPGNEGERLRCYQFTLHRELRRDMDSFSRQRLQPLKGLVGGANEPNFSSSQNFRLQPLVYKF